MQTTNIDNSIKNLLNIFNKIPNLKDLEKQLTNLADKYRKNEIIIPIIGEFSSGKSSLLNCLFNDKILSTDTLPTTNTINELRFSSDEDKIEIEFDDGNHKTLNGLFNLNQFNDQNVKLFRIFSKLPVVQKGIVLVDTPGLSSDLSSHSKILFDYAPYSDAFLIIIDCNQGFTKSTLEFLKITNSLKKNLYFVFTKIDTKPKYELESLKNFAENNLEFKPIKVVFTSSTENNIDDFIKLLNEIFQEKEEILLRNLKNDIKKIGLDAINLLNFQLASSDLNTAEIDLSIKNIQTEIEEFKETLKREFDIAKNNIQNAEKLSVKSFEEYMMQQIDSLVNIAFDRTEDLETTFDNLIRRASELAVTKYNSELNLTIQSLYNEIEAIANRVNIGNIPAVTIVKLVTDAVIILLFDYLIPGGFAKRILEATIGRILLKFSKNIPVLKEIWLAIEKPITDLIEALAKPVARSFVYQQIKSSSTQAVLAFEKELKNVSIQLLSKIETDIYSKISSNEKLLVESLESLKNQKKNKIEDYSNYISNLKNYRDEIEILVSGF